MKPQILFSLLIGVFAIDAGIPASAASPYNAVKNFTLRSNPIPGGVWSYIDPTGLLLQKGKNADGVTGLSQWDNDQPNCYATVVDRNVSGGTINYGTFVLPTNYLRLDPENTAFVAVRFTAPVAGKYIIKGNFLGIDTNQQSHSVDIMKKGVSIFTGIIGAYGTAATFRLAETLDVGETLDFENLTGTSGCTFLSTGLAVIITAP